MIISTCNIYNKIFREIFYFSWLRIIVCSIWIFFWSDISELSKIIFSPGKDWSCICWYKHVLIWARNFYDSRSVKFAYLQLNIYKLFCFFMLALINNLISYLKSLFQKFLGFFLSSFAVWLNEFIVNLVQSLSF